VAWKLLCYAFFQKKIVLMTGLSLKTTEIDLKNLALPIHVTGQMFEPETLEGNHAIDLLTL